MGDFETLHFKSLKSFSVSIPCLFGRGLTFGEPQADIQNLPKRGGTLRVSEVKKTCFFQFGPALGAPRRVEEAPKPAPAPAAAAPAQVFRQFWGWWVPIGSFF